MYLISDSLERLLKEYKKPLEESNPPILAENKVNFDKGFKVKASL